MARPPLARTLARGLALSCPACGVGRVFAGPFSWRMHDACPHCGVRFERARGEFTGALMFFMGFAGFMALMGWFVLTFFLGAPAAAGYAWLGFWGVGFPLAFYRNGKGLWIAVVHFGAGLRPRPFPVSPDSPPARSAEADEAQR